MVISLIGQKIYNSLIALLILELWNDRAALSHSVRVNILIQGTKKVVSGD